jgi:phage terminase large subunit
MPNLTNVTLTRADIAAAFWSRGALEYKMHTVQKEMYEKYLNAEPNSTSVWLLARQSGKSYCLAIIALMTAIKNPKGIIKMLTDTKVHMEDVLIPIFEELLEDCPEEFKPTYNKQRFRYTFTNGAQIQFAGSDSGHAERLRGQKSILVMVDEAGFCTNLRKIVQEILIPTTTHTGGKLILSSTPPESADHDFNSYVESSEIENSLTKKTVFDNPLLSQDQIEKIIKRYPGGTNDDSFRREYLCEMVKDASKSVFPEVSDLLLTEIVREFPKPSHYDCYVGMDVGFKDLTVVLFGYYDFRSHKIIVEDEIVKKGEDLRLKDFTSEIWKKEEQLWTNIYTAEKQDPKMRVSDIEPIVTQEIYNHSEKRLYFTPVKKEPGFKAPLINRIRMMLVNKEIVIHPRCKTFISHLKNGRWANGNKDEFARSPGMGHYDALDAFIYMVKVMDLNHNPYPVGSRGQNFFIKDPSKLPESKSNNTMDVMKAVFGGTRNKKR